MSNGISLELNETAALWVSELSYTLQSSNIILEKIYPEYDIEERNIIHNDFKSFFLQIKNEGYVEFVDIPFAPNLVIELTKKCNERCVHCYIPSKYKDNGINLSFVDFKKVIDEFIELGGKTIAFTGGEPTLNPSFNEIFNYTIAKDLKINILTNAACLNNEHIQMFTHKNVESVQISVYSVNPQIHDLITKSPGSCTKTKNAIDFLIKAGVNVSITCMVIKENYKVVSDVLEYAKEKGIECTVDFSICSCYDKSKDNLKHRLSLEELEESVINIMKYDKNLCKLLLVKKSELLDPNVNFWHFLNKPICAAGYKKVSITSSGDVVICPTWQQKILGNIKDSSLEDIWHSNNYLNKVRTIRMTDFNKCSTCKALPFCLHCPSRNYTDGEDEMSCPEVYCEQAFLFKKIYDKYFRDTYFS